MYDKQDNVAILEHVILVHWQESTAANDLTVENATFRQIEKCQFTESVVDLLAEVTIIVHIDHREAVHLPLVRMVGYGEQTLHRYTSCVEVQCTA